jgi:hypothetical protein
MKRLYPFKDALLEQSALNKKQKVESVNIAPCAWEDVLVPDIFNFLCQLLDDVSAVALSLTSKTAQSYSARERGKRKLPTWRWFTFGDVLLECGHDNLAARYLSTLSLSLLRSHVIRFQAIACLDRLYAETGCLPRTDELAMLGKLVMLKHVRERYRQQWSPGTACAAYCNNELECLVYCYENACPFGEDLKRLVALSPSNNACAKYLETINW